MCSPSVAVYDESSAVSSSQPGRREEEEEEAEQLMEAQLSRPADGVHALQVARGLGSVQALRLLCYRLSSHALSAVSSPAVSLAVEMVAGQSVALERVCVCVYNG